jgi:ATP-dependent helicase/nuclease subunit B
MAVRFILGRSGTGKTSYCVREIVESLASQPQMARNNKSASPDTPALHLSASGAGEGQNLIFLVPEQATYQAERAILSEGKAAGYHRLYVVSFSRLQFLLLGRRTAMPGLSRIGQQMIIQRLLRQLSGKLSVFEKSASQAGLGRQIADVLTELHRYGNTAEDIEELVRQLEKDQRNSLSRLKFSDIGLILKEYLKFIEGKFIDPDVQLNQACRGIAEAELVKGARLWVDGFAGFTGGELTMLAEVLKVVSEAKIALCLDAGKIDLRKPDMKRLDPMSIFQPTERTYVELVEVIKRCKVRLEEPVLLEEAVRFRGCKELAHIERSILKTGAAKRIKSGGRVRILSAANARAEAEFAARQILELVKEKGFRYRDIAVIASDIESYQHYIRALFEEYGIPFFIDRRQPLMQHPAVGLICSALDAVTGGFSHSDVFAYLKSDFAPVERSDADILENYCLAFGVSGGDWTSDADWRFAGGGYEPVGFVQPRLDAESRRAAEAGEQFDEKQINRIRARAVKLLLELRERICPDGNLGKKISAEEFTKAVFDFLDSLGVRERLGEWIEQARAEGQIETAEEHQQLYERLVDVFDEFAEVFGQEEGTAEDYFSILRSAFSQMTLALIPPTLDQVIVGSIERSRHPDLKAVFLLGATAKQFPAPVSTDGVLSDEDRVIAERAGFDLAQGRSERLVERQYLTYIAFTRPSEFLFITYPASDEKGRANVRTPFAAELEAMFEDLKEETITGEKLGIDKIHTEGELCDLLCRRLGKDETRDSKLIERENISGLLDEICKDKELGGAGRRVVSAMEYDNRAVLDKKVIAGLFGNRVESSATRLGTIAACPYQYFARYILELEERKEFKFEPLDLGRFYHRVLDGLIKQLRAEKKDIAAIEGGELEKVLHEQIAKLVQQDNFISNFVRHSAHNLFMIHEATDTLEDFVIAMQQMVRAGDFRPAVSEVGFGSVEDAAENLGEYMIKLSGERLLFMNGKIDRLDVVKPDGGKTAVVFDYKRKARSFDWSEFYHGLDMQLVIYMLAVRNAGERGDFGEVVGAFYVPVEASAKQTALEEVTERMEKFNYKAKGLFDGRFAEKLDRKASGDSEFYNFFVTKEGSPYGRYNTLGAMKPEDFEKVMRFTGGKIIELAEGIVSGKISVTPYRLGTEKACDMCKYRSVCRFDWQVNDYNHLESVNKVEVLERI